MDQQQRRKHRRKGHGCLGFGIVLVAVVVIFCILLFTTGVFDGLKYKVLGLFYQQKYTTEVEAASKEFGVDENLIYAVINTESHFREDAESSAGAIGLMQLMPDTFTWLQENLDGEATYSASDLKTPSVNIRYGTYFLSYLIDTYGDNSTAIAAYNAGFTNVDKWLSDPDCSSDGRTLTEIPYTETREYVKKVADARTMYEKIYG